MKDKGFFSSQVEIVSCEDNYITLRVPDGKQGLEAFRAGAQARVMVDFDDTTPSPAKLTEYYTKFIFQLREMKKRFEGNITRQNVAQAQIEDLMHELEFIEKMPMYEGYLLAKKASELRKERRGAKDDNRYCVLVKDYWEKNKKAFDELKEVITKFSAIAFNIETREYNPRASEDMLKELQDRFSK